MKLGYWRWLGVEDSDDDHAYIRVSDGQAWVGAWENPPSTATTDCEWVYHEVDVSAVAANEDAVSLRWTMGTTDESWPFCGWNIDDVAILGFVERDGEFASPTDFSMVYGQVSDGHLGDLFYSDDERLAVDSVLPGGPDPEVLMHVTSTSPMLSPDQLTFTLEAQVVEAGSYTQKISLYNYVSTSYEEVDSRAAAVGSDATVEVVITGNPQRFIDQATGQMQAELSWDRLAGGDAYTVGVDQVLWNVVAE